MFEVAFSFLVFIAFFLCGGPFIYMIVVMSSSSDYSGSCDSMKTFLLVTAFCNFINFIFCFYLMMRYGVYDNKHEYVRYTRFTQIICHIFRRDPWAGFYMCFSLFELVWAVISLDVDRQGCEGRLGTCYDINLICMWCYLAIGLIIFFFCICLEADYN